MGDGVFAFAYISGEQEKRQGERRVEDCLQDEALKHVGREAWCKVGVSPIVVVADWGTWYLHEEAILCGWLELALLLGGDGSGEGGASSEPPKARPLGD